MNFFVKLFLYIHSWKGSEVTGMIMVEVDILTGFSLVDEGSLQHQIGDTFKKLEKSHNKLAIYLDEATFFYFSHICSFLNNCTTFLINNLQY